MDLPQILLTHLHQLAASAAEDASELAGDLGALLVGLDGAVSGFAACQVVVVHGGHPVVTTAVAPDRDGSSVTSLRIPLALLVDGLGCGSRVVIHSSTSGALVDLAADLAHVLRPSGGREGTATGTPSVELDVDLPLVATGSGVDGLAELALVHRAAGLLIDQGHEPGTVLEDLHLQALAAGVAVHVLASQLLRV